MRARRQHQLLLPREALCILSFDEWRTVSEVKNSRILLLKDDNASLQLEPELLFI